MTVEEVSHHSRSAIAGGLYLLTIPMGVAMIVTGRLAAFGNAGGTAAGILAHEGLLRLGFAEDFFAATCYIAVIVLFYDLFLPVNKNLSLLAALFGVVGSANAALSGIFLLAPYAILKGAQHLSVFKVDELQGLALVLLRFHGHASRSAFVFFGLDCLVIGYLIFKAASMPRIVGALMFIIGSGWLISSFATFLSPTLARLLSPYLMAVGLGQVALIGWLLLKGLELDRWKESAGGARHGRALSPRLPDAMHRQRSA